MKCPFCSHAETQVVETRVSEDGDFVRRRRQCGGCDKRFTTYERPDLSFPVVVKKDGSRADFGLGKIRASMKLALRKRPVGVQLIEAALLRIEQKPLYRRIEGIVKRLRDVLSRAGITEERARDVLAMEGS